MFSCRINSMEEAKEITVSTFTRLGFNLDAGNFTTTLDNTLKLVQAFAKGASLEEFAGVVAHIKGLGFNRLLSDAEQWYLFL